LDKRTGAKDCRSRAPESYYCVVPSYGVRYSGIGCINLLDLDICPGIRRNDRRVDTEVVNNPCNCGIVTKYTELLEVWKRFTCTVIIRKNARNSEDFAIGYSLRSCKAFKVN
jgi:hypothetical protein